MQRIRLVSFTFALSAAIISIASAPSSSRRAGLRADDDTAACNGIGKNCTHTINCSNPCPSPSTQCCTYDESWSYYPEKME
jgi:hypothetical protein